MFTYFFKESENNKNDSLTLKLFDNQRQIRTLKKKVPEKTGFYRWYWRLNEKELIFHLDQSKNQIVNQEE